jgi:hypothetical protein
MFEITMETGNAAFGDQPEVEIARILIEVARKVANGSIEGRVMDYNGNVVGEYELRKAE